MGKNLRRVVAASAASALGLALAACGGGSDDDSSTGGTSAEGTKGGTLYYLQHFPFESSDPQRIYYGVQLANWRRVFYRGLLAFPMSEDASVATTPVPDLATDTGTSSDGGKVWSFTLKDGVKWEDGSDITCEDVQYGTSRVFANDVIIGGPNYTLSYIDVEDYPGPYKATPEQQAEFEKAVSCEGKTITFHFNKPWADFPQAIAGMMMTDPYKESFDEGDRSKWKILSNGPYKVEGGTWDKNKGATLVRNDEYDETTDDPEALRLALPDTIEWQINPSDTAGELFNDRLIQDAGNDQYAITTARLAPNQMPQISGPVEERYTNVLSPYVSYLVPNSKTITNVKVREALAVATNLNGYVKALGGETAAAPAETVIAADVPGSEPNPAFANDNDNNGDPEAAKALLEESGEKLPYPIKLAYQKSPTTDKAMAILQESWEAAGFKVELDGLSDTYYDVISSPDKDVDLMWAGWGADWPSAMTVLPPLFDSRPNVSAATCGQDYGCYQNDDFEALVDQAANAEDVDEQTEFLKEADKVLGETYAYIPLEATKFNWLHGSKVTGFTTTAASSSYAELGLIGVQN
ncbi:ABC transporter substrate-binding protein [Nocardioides sp. GY 10113]|uniref:ABC transporter substrate-binding protein n=1 Tax=Nocardioides sp. GY 10113 TaxID=2569761 RepID=UPI0010A8EAE6|nr:ABC transporter substrate-binding protein [Nocardioides sp. GY 10113]TIC82484.1 ABC transporter substrate-binding protein [Nocardioides sp. GY 10113]